MDSRYDLITRMTDSESARSIMGHLASVPEYYLEFAEDAGFSPRMTKAIIYALFAIKSDVEFALGEKVSFWNYARPESVISFGDAPAKYNFILYVAFSLYSLQMTIKSSKPARKELIKVGEDIYEPVLKWLDDINDIFGLEKMLYSGTDEVFSHLVKLWAEFPKHGVVIDEDGVVKLLERMDKKIRVPHELTAEDRKKAGRNSGKLAKYPALKNMILDSYERFAQFRFQNDAAEKALKEHEGELKKLHIEWSTSSVIRNAKDRKMEREKKQMQR